MSKFNSLEAIIADIESAGNNFAMRFEPGVYARTQIQTRYGNMIDAAKLRNRCSRETAKIICSVSWGRFQIMGFNLYDQLGLNYPFSVGQFMSDADAQAQLFRQFCEARKIYYSVLELQSNPAAVTRFAKIYNGSTAYADKIFPRLNIL
jgi:hypothetical protein